MDSDKNGIVCLLLCIFVGYLGIHRFFVGKMGTGILMIVTIGGFGLWTLIDLIMIVCGKFTDSEGTAIKLAA
jgi:TM2 domain-containing membrane protein YozV